jgi:uncharacterized protein YukE
MANTLFFQEKFQHDLAITSLFLEYLGGQLQQPETPEPVDAIKVTLKACELCANPQLSDVDYVVMRLKRLNKEIPKAAGGDGKRSFASEYLKWLQAINTEQACCYIAGYDITRARELYNYTDVSVLTTLLRYRAEHHWQDTLVMFEACLFGFGGSYGDEQTTTFDIKEDREGMEANLKAMGF